MEVQYPLWLPKEAWNEYIKMRKTIKKPLTSYAEKLAIKMLDQLRQSGHDPEKVLEQSIFQSWQGLFPYKEIQGLTVKVEDKKILPGHCPKCGGGSSPKEDYRECKSCGNKFNMKDRSHHAGI